MIAALLQYPIAFIVVSHGLVYLIFGAMSITKTGFPQVYGPWKGRSIALGQAIQRDSLKSLTEALWLLAGVGLIIGGAAIGVSSLLPGYWRPICVCASIAGVTSFAVFWDGQVEQFANQGGVGMIISLAIIAGSVLFPIAFA